MWACRPTQYLMSVSDALGDSAPHIEAKPTEFTSQAEEHQEGSGEMSLVWQACKCNGAGKRDDVHFSYSTSPVSTPPMSTPPEVVGHPIDTDYVKYEEIDIIMFTGTLVLARFHYVPPATEWQQ